MGATLPPFRDRPALGPVSVFQLVAAELVAAAAFISWRLPKPWPYTITAIAALLVALILVVGSTTAGHRWRIRRRSANPGDVEVDTAGDALAGLAPGLQLRDVTERGTDYGVAFDGYGWFAVLAVAYADPTEPTGLDAATMRAVSSVLFDSEVTVSGIQVVSHLVPSPSAELEPDTACAQSYAELLGDDPVVSHHMTWLAVRLDGTDAAVAAAERGGGVAGARRAVVAVARRLARRLADHRVSYTVLSADSLKVALTHSVSGETVSAALNRRAREDLRSWRLGGLVQATFAVDGKLDDIDGLRRLWMSMAVLSASFVSISVVLRPSGSRAQLQSLLRVAYDAALNDGAPDELVHAAAECGVRLWRHDGQQAAATYASAPTGGGCRVSRPVSKIR